MYTNEEIARIINALENAVWAQNWDDRHDDVYDACSDAVKDAAKDAIDLILDLTGEVKPKLYTSEGKTIWSSWYICTACENPVDPLDKYCRHCGSPLNWEDNNENRT